VSSKVVERSFGVLKNKWQILKGVPLYPTEKQSKIIVACFALHNFAMDNNEPGMDMDDVLGDGTYCHDVLGDVTYCRSTSQQIDSVPDWLVATANDNIVTVRDWIAAGLYGLT